MSHPILALKAALRQALLADAPLLALLAGPRIHDEPPRAAPLPLIAFGDASARDNGAADYAGQEITLALVIMSQQGGSREALRIAERVEAVLAQPLPALSGHRLVNLGRLTLEVRRERTGDLWRATLRLRAVTELE